MQDKRFRDDLYYRLNVVPIWIAPLRDRPEDIPLLAEHFLQFFRQRMNVATSGFSPATMALITRYQWPGNVRELRNIVERMLVLHGHDGQIQPDSLPVELQSEVQVVARPSQAPTSLMEAVDAYERELVLNALRQANGVQTRAAEILGTTRRILKYRMDKLNIKDDQISAA
jgi:transcriptional regulator with PAS, ATPase and Fis domain